MAETRYRLGCDVGGTFTDFVLLDQQTGQIHVHKRLTTPAVPADAIIGGVEDLLERVPDARDAIQDVVHGTTIASNLVLERKGAPTGLLTTEGFRDVLEIGREERYDTYDIFLDMPRPLVPRSLRKGVPERLNSAGEVLRPLGIDALDQAIRELEAAGVQSVAVSYLHSYQNAAHEIETARRLEELVPHMEISLSSSVLPEIREYERTSTTVVDAYVKPVVATYLEDLVVRLRQLGLGDRILIMLSGGGISSVETARDYPVRMIESGPAAGVLATQFFGGLLGLDNCLSFDMGGTTAKAGLVRNGQILKTSDFEVDRVHRFKKGSGLPIKVPSIDLLEVGAGGGSIARIDQYGLIDVGPESAGASPGPACYGLGGTEPTVTDADLLLGYLNPDYFLGGRMRLDVQAAGKAIGAYVAGPLGLGTIEAARGVHEVVNENMASAIRMYCLENGEDPSSLSLVAFGGAGPIHAYGVARKLHIERIVVPPAAGIMSALGFLTARRGVDLVRTYKARLHSVSPNVLRGLLDDMLSEARRILRSDDSTLTTQGLSADMRYVGQGYEINVTLQPTVNVLPSIAELREAFDQAYSRVYGRHYPDLEVELLNLRMAVGFPATEFNLAGRTNAGEVGPRIRGQRQVHFSDQAGPVNAAVYGRAALRPGEEIRGPAIIEEPESTTVVGPDGRVTVDRLGGLLITLEGSAE